MKKKKAKNRVRNEQPVITHSYRILGHYIRDKKDAAERHYRDEEEMKQQMRRIDDIYLGTLEKDGLLQEELNQQHLNILIDLKTDHPKFTRRRILVFSLTAAGIPNDLIWQRAHLARIGSLYTMKCLMIQQIAARNSPRKEEYLSLLRR